MHLFDSLRLVIALLYLLSSILFLFGVRSETGGRRKAAAWLAAAGFLLHTLVLMHFLASTSFRVLPSGFYVRLFSWGVIAVFFFLWWRMRVGYLALVASPLALLVYVVSMAVPGMRAPVPASLSGLFLGLHIGTLFLCFGLMAIAFGAGIAFLHLNRRIKSKAGLKGIQGDMPALSTFDEVNRIAVYYGFPLYTLGLAAGFFRPNFTWDRIIFWFSLIVWFLFAFVFHQRLVTGWRGRKPAQAAIAIFLLLCLALSFNFVLPTSQSFHP
jgi:ABC-type uncharacterized transport system permease subunit